MRFYKTATNELGQDLFYQVVSENETQVNTLEFIIDTIKEMFNKYIPEF